MRIVFMGTPDFSVAALRSLANAGHEVVCVYCQPPKPAGRGQKEQKTPVHIEAEKLGLLVRTPKNFRDEGEKKLFAELNADIAVVAAYGLILPPAILDAPKMGCINIHASLLPRWRGAAPIQRAIMAGDKETGITIMRMDAGLDTGDMLLRESVPITGETTASSLHDELSVLGAKMILRALEALANGKITPVRQNDDDATYAAKLSREEGKVDWTLPADEIERRIRALTPWPGAFFMNDGERIKILKAEIEQKSAAPAGTLLDDVFTVACGKSALRVLELQREGKKPTDGPSALRGLRIEKGYLFK